jgi:LPS export ABC transporter permease LptF/LPS export ABC transporter permease LptG
VRNRLNRYIISEILGPLGLGFLVYTFILLIRFLFQSAEMIIRRGLPSAIVGRLLLLTLPNIVVLTLPMSLLFGILIAVGRLSSDSELIAMRSSGISLLALYKPILMLSAFFTLLNTVLMVYALPWGNHALQELRLEIMTQSISQQVQPRVFYEEWEGKVVYVFEVPEGEKRWKGVFLAESLPSSGANNQITIADWGEVRVDPTGEKVILRLYNAVRHKVDMNAPDRYEISRHKRLDLILDDQFTSGRKAKMSVSKGIRELTIQELRDLREDPTVNAEQHNLAEVEIHKKFSIPMACMVFGLFALPLGINNRRGGKASGFALSIGVIIVYYILLNNGEEAARFGKVPGWLAMWSPNILLAVCGVFLLMRRNRDKSLLLSRVDRWVREDVWGGLLRLKGIRQGLRQERRQEQQRRRQLREAALPERKARRRDLVLLLPRLRLAFPNLLDRYVVRQFSLVFSLVVLSGISLFIIFDLSETIDDILKNKVANGLVLNYYKYLSLQMFYEIAPIVVLVTTLMTFSLLARKNEIIACKALGVSLYRLALPALAVSLLVTLFCTYLESEVLPASNEKVAQLKDRIRGNATVHTYRRADRQWLFGQGRYIYNYLHYDPQQQTLQRLQVFDFDANHRLNRRLAAETATFIGDGWVFSNGWSRSFNGVDVTEYKRFDVPKIVNYPETPSYFDSEIRPPEQMRYGELKEYIEEIKESGQAVPELQVELYNKIAFPVVSLIMALVGLPFAFRLGKQGALYGIGFSVVLGMIFLGIYAFFTKMGEAGALPAAVAVWSPGAVFSMLGIYLFLGVRT